MKARALYLTIHRYLGLLLALFVTFVGVTGTAIAFMDELDEWLNADVIRIAPHATALPITGLVSRVERAYPEAQVTGFVFGDTPQHAWLFKLGPRDQTKPSVNEVWVDPYTGDVRGDRFYGAARFDRRHLLPALHTLHQSLFMERSGKTLMGTIAALWFLSSLLGIVLAIPRSGGLLKVFSVKLNGSRFKAWLDLHRVVGLTTAVVLLGSTFTALYLALPDPFKAALNPIAPITEPLKQLPKQAPQPPRINPERAAALAQRALPGGTVRGLNLHREQGVYQVRVRLADDINIGNGTGRVFIDMQSGAVVAATSYKHARAGGDRFLAWLFPLHSGQAFGLPGQIIICIMGLMPPLLAITGIYIYWHKRRARAAQRLQAGTSA